MIISSQLERIIRLQLLCLASTRQTKREVSTMSASFDALKATAAAIDSKADQIIAKIGTSAPPVITGTPDSDLDAVNASLQATAAKMDAALNPAPTA